MQTLRSRRSSAFMSLVKLSAVASVSVFSLLPACGSGDDDVGADATGGSTSRESGGSGNEVAGEANTNGGSTARGGGANASGGESNTGADGNGGAAGESSDPGMFDPGEDGPGYDAVDLESLDLSAAPDGCGDGFDPDSGTLTLELTSDAALLLLSAADGVVTANGTPCASADGDPANASDLTSIRVNAGDEDDTLYLDGGADFGASLVGPDGSIDVDLGAGDDTVYVLGSDAADAIHLGTNGDSLVVDFSGNDEADLNVTGAESAVVSGGPGRDVIESDGAALSVDAVDVPLRLFGDGANDTLLGGAASDELHGGIGNDTLLADRDAGGADQYDGGSGEDFVDYARRPAGVMLSLDGVADDGEPDEQDNIDPSVEDARGGQGPNTITGSSLANHLWGGPAIDTIRGGDGDDFLYGDAGDDDLQGENGDDFLYGEDGDDAMSGGAGDDLLDGFPGTNDVDGGAGDGDICLLGAKDQSRGCEL